MTQNKTESTDNFGISKEHWDFKHPYFMPFAHINRVKQGYNLVYLSCFVFHIKEKNEMYFK